MVNLLMGKYGEFQAKINSTIYTTIYNITIKRTNKNKNLLINLLKEGQISHLKTGKKTYAVYLKKYLGKPNIHAIHHITDTKKSTTPHTASQLGTWVYVTNSKKGSYLLQATKQIKDKSIKILKIV